MESPFSYKVKYINLNNEQQEEAGIGFASSYSEATSKIELVYGSDLIEITGLFLLEESPLYIFTDIYEYDKFKSTL